MPRSCSVRISLPTPLFERKQRLGALNISKAASPCSFTLLYACPKHRVIGRRKGKLIDNQHRQGLPRNIHALPEACTTNQNCIAMLPKKAPAWPPGCVRPAQEAGGLQATLHAQIEVLRRPGLRREGLCKEQKPTAQLGKNAFEFGHAQQ
jgi:hypothetical protein